MPDTPHAASQNSPLRKGLFSSLRARMLLYFGLTFGAVFLVFALIFTFGIPFTDYAGEYAEEKAQAFKALDMAAEQKKRRFDRWLLERRGDARVLAESEIMASSVLAVRSILKELMATGMEKQEAWGKIKREESFRQLVQHLKLVKASYGFYEEIDIADAETGEIFAATNDSGLGKNVAQNDFFTQPLRKSGVYVNFERDVLGDGDVDFFISHAIGEKDAPGGEAKPFATLVMRVDTGDVFESMLHTGVQLGRTGEVVLVDQEARILAPLKYPLPDGTRPAPLEYRIQTKPATFASQGMEGIIDANDYRGFPVLAAVRSIQISPEITWGMVVKQDRSEVLAKLNKSASYFFLILTAAFLFLAALTYWIASGLSRPIHLLSRTVRLVESGDLSARAPATGPYEAAVLALAFNSMAQRIQDWHGELERRIQERTHELSMTNEELERQKKFLEAILDCVEDGIVACDNNAVLTLFNRATREFHGLPQEPLPAEKWAEHYNLFFGDGKTPMKMEDVPLFKTLKGEEAVDNVEMVIAPKEGAPRTLLATGRALIDDNGESLGAVVSMHDITARKQAEEKLRVYRENLEKIVEERTLELKTANAKLLEALAEKELLLREVHHRVKNNMQIISSLLNMQARFISDGRMKGIFDDCRNRIKSMAMVHEKLYAHGDFARIDFNEYIRSISSGLFRSYAGAHGRVAFRTELEDGVFLGIEAAIPCGLILNELITNALKYAFPEGRAGEIRVAMRRVPDSGKYELTVADNGIGFQEGAGFNGDYTLGLTLIDTLVGQLNGVMEIERENGTEYRITFEERIRKEL